MSDPVTLKQREGTTWSSNGWTGFCLSFGGAGLLVLSVFLSYYLTVRGYQADSPPAIWTGVGLIAALILLVVALSIGVRAVARKPAKLLGPVLTIAISGLTLASLFGLLILVIGRSG